MITFTYHKFDVVAFEAITDVIIWLSHNVFETLDGCEWNNSDNNK